MQSPEDTATFPNQPIPTSVDQPSATSMPADSQTLPQEPTLESPFPLEEERTEMPPVFEPAEAQLPQTQEKRYMVQEIDSPTQTPEPLIDQAVTPTEPESYDPDLSQSPTVPASEQEPTTQSQKLNEPLSSFDTHTSLPQPEIQPSQT